MGHLLFTTLRFGIHLLSYLSDKVLTPDTMSVILKMVWSFIEILVASIFNSDIQVKQDKRPKITVKTTY